MSREEEIRMHAAVVGLNVRDMAILNGNDRKSAENVAMIAQASVVNGAEWADNHPQLDVAGPTSATRVRMILLRNLMNLAKQYPDKTMDEVPEIKEAFDLVDNFDKCCEVAGFTLNENTGFYNIPE